MTNQDFPADNESVIVELPNGRKVVAIFKYCPSCAGHRFITDQGEKIFIHRIKAWYRQ